MNRFVLNKNTVFYAAIPFLASVSEVSAYIPFSLAFCFVVYFVFFGNVDAETKNYLLRFFYVIGGLIFIGCVRGSFNDPYSVLKDAWYYINAGIYFLYAGLCAVRGYKTRIEFVSGLILGGFASSLWFLSSFFINPELLQLSATEIRDEAGFGCYDSVVALFLVTNCWRIKDVFRSNYLILVVVVCLVAVFMSFSRGIAFSLLISLLITAGIFNKSPLFKIFSLAILFIALVFILRFVVDISDPESHHTFFGKIAHIIDEGTITSGLTVEEINARWRGYEAARAYEQFLDADLIDKVLGQGFGTLIDVGIYIVLGSDIDNPVRYIEILHNGYLYSLVKSGLLGLMVVCGFYAYMLKISLVENNKSLSRSALLFSVMVIIISTWSVAGIFNKTVIVSVMALAGYCIFDIEKRQGKFL